MDIQQLSMTMAQSKLMSDVSTAVLAKSLQVAQTQAAGNQNLISNVAPMQVIQDPALGNKVNLLA